MRVTVGNACNAWHVAEVNENLWIQDTRSPNMPKKMRGVFIHVENLGGLGQHTGLRGAKSLTIHKAETFVAHLQQAIKEAKEIESLKPQYHAVDGNT